MCVRLAAALTDCPAHDEEALFAKSGEVPITRRAGFVAQGCGGHWWRRCASLHTRSYVCTQKPQNREPVTRSFHL